MSTASQGQGEVGTAVQSSSSSSGSFSSPKIGTTLGRYEILAHVGHGAMATVFRARDPQLGRDVAIKVMSMVHAARGGAAERFRREAHAVAALKHPGIVEIYDFVPATEEDPSYIVAELIQGPTLRKLLDDRGGRLLPEIAALIALPLAEALAVAHERGVIHRDVKPDNVMIETSGESARVVLTDFGVAHITGMETMTATGALVGSPAYMSPEQSRGHDVGPTADLWSLGAMIYEMVTGVVPFSGKDPFTMIAAILRGSFRRPSQVVATVGPDFEQMILRCLKASSAERYPNATLLVSELHEFTRAVGLVPEAKMLRQYLDDPAATEANLRPKVADAAVARARQFARRGQLARALAEIGHATAYVPKHASADRLLKRLSASRVVIKIAVALLGLIFASGIVWLAKPLLARKTPHPIGSVVTHTLGIPGPPQGTKEATTTGTATSVQAPHVAGSGSSPAAALKIRTPRRARPTQSAATPVLHEPEVPTITGPKPSHTTPSIEPTPVPKHEPVPIRNGTISLFAKGAFCYPSLDDHPVHDLMPVYREIPPGKHKVYCSRTKQSPKEFAGEVDLPAGARMERTVTLQEGRLTIARPR